MVCNFCTIITQKCSFFYVISLLAAGVVFVVVMAIKCLRPEVDVVYFIVICV